MQSLPDQRTRERFGLVVFPAVMSRATLARVLAERSESLRVFEMRAQGPEQALSLPSSVDPMNTAPPTVRGGCFEFAKCLTRRRSERKHTRRSDFPLILPERRI